jgi:hypothetical protein
MAARSRSRTSSTSSVLSFVLVIFGVAKWVAFLLGLVGRVDDGVPTELELVGGAPGSNLYCYGARTRRTSSHSRISSVSIDLASAILERHTFGATANASCAVVQRYTFAATRAQPETPAAADA